MKVFLDTNILMDIVFERNFCLNEELKIIACAKDGLFDCSVSALSIVNTIYVSKKYGLSLDNVKNTLLKLSECVEILDVRGIDAVTMLSSSDWKDYEDSLQYISAENFVADFILTRKKKDYSLSSIPVYTPLEFVELHQ